MSWAVTRDVGERGPAINLNGFKRVHNIRTKKFFNTVKGYGPCLGEHGPAIESNVFEKLHTIQTKTVLNTVKWAGPCLEEHDPFLILTLLTICIKRKTLQRREMSWAVTGDVWERGPAIKLNGFKLLHNIQTKKVVQHRERNWAVFGEAVPRH